MNELINIHCLTLVEQQFGYFSKPAEHCQDNAKFYNFSS